MDMSMQPAGDDRFEFDKADRMRRALRVSGVGIGEMSELLDVSRNTIGNWINGRAEPRTRDLKEVALKTGMPYEWLRTGRTDDNGHSPVGPTGIEPMTSTVESGHLAEILPFARKAA